MQLTQEYEKNNNAFKQIFFLFFLLQSVDLINIQVAAVHIKPTYLYSVFLFLYLILVWKDWTLPKVASLFFIGILINSIIAAFLGPCVLRSLLFSALWILCFFCYFILPYNCFLKSKTALQVYWASFHVVGIYGIFQFLCPFLGIVDPFVGQKVAVILNRSQALTYEPSYYALFLTPFVIYHMTYFLLKKAPATSKDYVNIIFINIYYLVSTSGALSFVYLLYSLFVVSLFFSKHSTVRKKAFTITGGAFAGLLLILTLAPAFFSGVFAKFLNQNGAKHGSFVERLEGLFLAIQGFYASPFFGIGFGALSHYHYQKEVLQGNQFFRTDLSVEAARYLDPMNITTEVIGSLGFIGFVSFAIFYLWIFYLHAKVLKQQNLSDNDRSMTHSLLLANLFYLLFLQCNQNVFRPYLWCFLAMTVAQLTLLLKKTSSNALREDLQVSSYPQDLSNQKPLRALHQE